MAIFDEMMRQGDYIYASSPVRCPDVTCSNHNPLPPLIDKFHRHGKTRDGSPRFRCRICGKTSSVPGPTHKQKRPRINSSIFLHLVNKTPLNRLMEIEDVGPNVLYGKIAFIYRQCALFAGERESRLRAMKFDRLRLSTDRQDYFVNWGSRERRQSIQLTSIGTADAASGYVFGLQCNFDPKIDPEWIEQERLRVGDPSVPAQLRRYPHIWSFDDYMASLNRNAGVPVSDPTLPGELVEVDGTARDDLDATEAIVAGQQLPSNGVQIHADYLVHGHFQLLKQLLPGAAKINFYMDSDAGLVAAAMGAFADRIAAHDAEIVQLLIEKNLTIDHRRQELQDRTRWFKDQMSRFPTMSKSQVRFELMKEQVVDFRRNTPLPDRRSSYLPFLLPDSAEPIKELRYVTDTDHLSDNEMTWLMLDGTLWPLDTVFNMLRRRLVMFERPVVSVKRARRLWHPYAAYNPLMVIQMLKIFRVWYNYVWQGKTGMSPAQRLGLAAGRVRFDHILGFDIRDQVVRHFERANHPAP